MRNKRKTERRFLGSEPMSYLRFAAVPAAAVLLIVIIVLAGRSGKSGEPSPQADFSREEETENTGGADSRAGSENGGEAENGTGGEAENGTSGEAESETEAAPSVSKTDAGFYADIDISQYPLKQDEVPELTAMVRTYCQAKEDGDPVLLASLYGISDMTDEEITASEERMELVRASIKRYENISCYSVEGPEPDTYVIFPYFELQYREAECLMPQLTWAYVKKNDEGRYIMVNDLTPAEEAYVSRVAQKEDVAALRAQVSQAMEEAIEADATLKSIYSGESEVVVGGSQ